MFVAAALLISTVSANAYAQVSVGVCDPQTDPDECECVVQDCSIIDEANLPDFRDPATYTAAWVTTYTNSATGNPTVVFDLEAVPGKGLVVADPSPWNSFEQIQDFLEHISGVIPSRELINFDIVQLGQSALVDSTGQDAGVASSYFLLNVLTDGNGNLNVDGTLYNIADAQFTVPLVTPNPIIFWPVLYPQGGDCKNLAVSDGQGTQWEADLCTELTAPNPSSPSVIARGFHSAESKIFDLKKNGSSTTLRLIYDPQTQGFRWIRVPVKQYMDFQVYDYIDFADSGFFDIWEVLRLLHVYRDAIFRVSDQRLHTDDSVHMIRGECALARLQASPNHDDTDSTSHGTFPPGEVLGCASSYHP